MTKKPTRSKSSPAGSPVARRRGQAAGDAAIKTKPAAAAPSPRSKLPKHVGSQELADVLGITVRWVSKLSEEGVIAKAGRGKYPLAASVQSYIHYARETVGQKAASTSADKLRAKKEEQIERAMARDDRVLIELSEANEVYEEMAGVYLESIGGLPARLTSDPEERRKFETTCYAERGRVAVVFAEKGSGLQQDLEPSEASGTDGPGGLGEEE